MWALIKPKPRHIVALAIFLPLLLLMLYLVTINSEDYEEAERFVSQDTRVAASIGRVQKTDFKFWSGFESATSGGGGHASYVFEATTDKGIFTVDVRLRRASGTWRMEAANIRGRDGTQNLIEAAGKQQVSPPAGS